MRRIVYFICAIGLVSFLFIPAAQAKSKKSKKKDKVQQEQVVAEIAEAYGDLDKDGVDEKVVIYNSDKKGEQGTIREVRVYKNNNGKWTLWHTSVGPVLPSEHANIKEDPFESVNVERGCIVINHSGGGHQKWAYTHRYRFQNDTWKLIGATIFYGALCDFWDLYDYNLSIGKINYKKEIEDCESNVGLVKSKIVKSQYDNKLSVLPDMDGFKPGTNKVDLTDEIYFYF